MDQTQNPDKAQPVTQNQASQMPWPRRIVQLIFVGIVLMIFWPFLISMALAGVFASLLWPLMQRHWQWTSSKALKAFVLTLGFTSLILAPVLLIIGGGILALQNQIKNGVFSNMDIDPSGLIHRILSHKRIIEVQEALHVSDEQVRDAFFSGLQKAQTIIVDFLQALLATIPHTAIAFVIMVLCLYFLLKEYRYLESFLHKYSPCKKEHTRQLIETFRGASVSVVMAGIISGTAQAIVLGAGAATTGLANPAVVTMIVFVASFFPFLGSGLVSVSLIIIGLIKGDMSNVLLFLPFAAASSVVDNIIYPVVVGSRSQLNPLVSFIAVIGGVQLFGLFGIFLGPITVILCFQILQLITENRITSDDNSSDKSDSGLAKKLEQAGQYIRNLLQRKGKT